MDRSVPREVVVGPRSRKKVCFAGLTFYKLGHEAERRLLIGQFRKEVYFKISSRENELLLVFIANSSATTSHVIYIQFLDIDLGIYRYSF